MLVYRNKKGEVISQNEAEHNAECEALAGEINDAYNNADWYKVSKKFHSDILAARLTTIMGVVLALAFYGVVRLSSIGGGIDVSTSDLVPLWMMTAAATGISSLGSWMRVILGNKWRCAKGGDVINGVVVDILTVTFAGRYIETTKLLFKRVGILSMIAYSLLAALYQEAFNLHGFHALFTAGNKITSVFAACGFFAATILTIAIVINCWRIWNIGEVVAEQMR